MIIEELEKIRKYDFLFYLDSKKEEESIIISIKNKCLYYNSNICAFKVKLKISSISEEEQNVYYIIPKLEFLHLLPYSNTLTIDLNNKYKTDTNIFGIFKKDEKYKIIYESLEEIFSENSKKDYLSYLDIDSKEMYEQLLIANNFTDDKNNNDQSKFVFIQNNTIFSSSLYRIYTKDFKLNTKNNEFIALLNSVITSIKNCDYPINIYKNNNSIWIQDSNLELIYANISKVDPLPIFSENFISMKKDILSVIPIQLSNKELISKLDFLKFYAKESNSQVELKVIDSKRIVLSIKNNSCNLEIKNSNEAIKPKVFSFNIEYFLSALKSLSFEENSFINIYEKEESNIICLELDKNNSEYFYSSKMVNK